MPLDELWRVPPALRRHAIREAHSAVAPDAAPLGSVTVEGILKLARGGAGTREIHLPAFVTAVVRSGEMEELALYHKRDKVYTGERDLLPGTQGFERWIVKAREFGILTRGPARPEVAYLRFRRAYRVRMCGRGIILPGPRGDQKGLQAMNDRKVPRDSKRRVGNGRGGWPGIHCELERRFRGERRRLGARVEV